MTLGYYWKTFRLQPGAQHAHPYKNLIQGNRNKWHRDITSLISQVKQVLYGALYFKGSFFTYHQAHDLSR